MISRYIAPHIWQLASQYPILTVTARRQSGKTTLTVNSDYFRGLAAFQKAFPHAMASSKLIYGGTESQARSQWGIRGWRG